MKKINCDVVVVGAGPGGSMAAKTCAKFGLDTVLVERKEYPSKPNCMDCFVGRRLVDYVRIDKKIISSTIYKMAHFSPDGTEIHTPYYKGDEICYVLNRKNFDNEVLKLALKEGPGYMNKTRVIGLIRENGEIKGIKAKIDEKEDVEIRSNIVIGADGVESKIGKWAGIYSKGFDINDQLCITLDSTIDNVDMDEEEYHTWHRYYGYKDISDMGADSGPKGDGKRGFNVGTFRSSVIPKKGELSNTLNYFLKNNPFYSKSKIVEIGGGVIPTQPLKKFTTDGVMLVGDAAHQINLPHVAGVLHAMDAGVLAGETAVESHEEGNFSSDFLSKYEKRWYRLHGEQDMLGYYMSKVGSALPKKYIDMIFHLLKDNDTVFTDELFEKVMNSPKIISKLTYEFKKEGLDIPNMLSFVSLLKKYHRNYWDTFVE